MREEWKPVAVKGYEHLYEVSNQGRVRSLRRGKNGALRKLQKDRGGYLVLILSASGIKKSAKVHALVINAFSGPPSPGYVVDHINGNKTDNYLENLRYVTHSQNHQNCGKRGGMSSSKYKGVTWYSLRNRWRVLITADGKEHYVGVFKDELEAAHAYDTAALKYHGEFANLNFPEEQAQ